MAKINLDKNCLYALLLLFMASAVLPACSSTDEAAQEDTSQEECIGGGPRGDEGHCCDADMMQPGCPAM
jgi:hypothetical protein